ncbi:MAG: ABC transporter ATP-binding protein [Candidatus Kapabacteria bacterium]|nr:ABC transporter ATP-binding protein [Candidatus Kapabacteria bacterium]
MMHAVKVVDVHKSYARVGQSPTHVLRGVSCSIDHGEFVALVGPSGAGKSTLLHVMATLDVADRGTVTLGIDGAEIDTARMRPADVSRIRNRHIGVVFQFHHLLPEFTAIENVMMPLLIGGVDQAEARHRAQAVLDRVGVRARADHAPAELSGGEQQRVAIARAVIQRPTILFADEPTGNLDSVNAAEVVDLLSELQQDDGMTCIVVTHSVDLAAKAHRVLHMRDGILVD